MKSIMSMKGIIGPYGTQVVYFERFTYSKENILIFLRGFSSLYVIGN